KARQNPATFGVDFLQVRGWEGDCTFCSGGVNAVAIEQHRSGREGCATVSVDERAVANQGVGHEESFNHRMNGRGAQYSQAAGFAAKRSKIQHKGAKGKESAEY